MITQNNTAHCSVFRLSTLLFSLILILTTALDQMFKHLAQTALQHQSGSIVAIPGFIDFKYAENLGAAWSLFHQWPQALSIFSVSLTLLFIILAIRYKPTGFQAVLWGLFCGGALGNCIDRVFHGAVIDYIHLTFYPSYPIFNFADTCIVSAVVLGAVCYWHDIQRA